MTKPDEVPEPRDGIYPAELLTCPFCGRHPRVTVQNAPVGIRSKPFVGIDMYIACQSRKCGIWPIVGLRKGASGPKNYLRQEVIRHRVEKKLWNQLKAIWNKRTFARPLYEKRTITRNGKAR